MKVCSKCGNGKPLSEFGKASRMKDGLRTWCKECVRKCKICGDSIAVHSENRHEVACIDHCHESLKVRGLLCWHCNIGLGKFFDSVERLRAAIEYLEVHNAGDGH